MRPHAFDPTSFFFGLFFAALACELLSGVGWSGLSHVAWFVTSLLITGGLTLIAPLFARRSLPADYGAGTRTEYAADAALPEPVGARPAPMHGTGRKVSWPWAVREVILVAACYLLYFLVRGLTAGDEVVAVANANRLIDLERATGLFQEEQFQALIVDHGWAVTVANWIYIWGHWPFILVVAIWLMLCHPHVYRVTRNGLLLSGAVGLVIFVAFPVAPPRLIELGLVDTVTEHSQAYRVLQPSAFVNQFAAMPSFHFGWNLLVGIAMVRAGRGPVRILGLLTPPAMLFAVVATANHFIADVLVGGAICLTALLVVEWWTHQRSSWMHLPLAAYAGRGSDRRSTGAEMPSSGSV